MGYIYIASPYSDPHPDIREMRFEAAMKYAAHLLKEKRTPYSPIVHNHPLAEKHDLPKNWDFWQENDITMLNCCGEMHVLMLRGWKDSTGVKAEIKFAEKEFIPVKYIDPDTYRAGVPQW